LIGELGMVKTPLKPVLARSPSAITFRSMPRFLARNSET
jgi:hypothetical protein